MKSIDTIVEFEAGWKERVAEAKARDPERKCYELNPAHMAAYLVANCHPSHPTTHMHVDFDPEKMDQVDSYLAQSRWFDEPTRTIGIDILAHLYQIGTKYFNSPQVAKDYLTHQPATTAEVEFLQEQLKDLRYPFALKEWVLRADERGTLKPLREEDFFDP